MQGTKLPDEGARRRGPGATTQSTTRAAPNGGIRGANGRTSGRGGATSGAVSTVIEPEAWSVWWHHNREAFLWDLRAEAAPRGAVTAAGLHDSELRSAPILTAIPHAPSTEQVHRQIVPLLLERIRTEDHGAPLAEAVLALGRITHNNDAEVVTEALLPLLAHDEVRVAESVALAFGLLGTERGRDALLDISTCSSVGHQLSGQSPVPDSLRITATLALGLLGDVSISPRLRDLAEGGLEAADDLRASAVLALGIMGQERDDGTAPWLDKSSQDRRLPLNIQVSLATTLGRFPHPGAVDALVNILGDRDVDAPTRQAAVASLGQVATLEDARALKVLHKAYDKNRDAGTRQLALLSLARVGALSPVTSEGRDQQRSIDKLVRRELRKPSHSIDRPFTALAAGLLLRGRPELHRDLGPRLHDAYEDASNPSQRGAFALSLGLAGIAKAAKDLRADLEDTKDAELQGHLAVALGLLGHTDAAPFVQERLMAPGQGAGVRRSFATALRLLDVDDTAPMVTTAYLEAPNRDLREGMAAALGELRHGSALDALLSVCADDDLDAASRASAYAALGRLAETTAEPFAARLTLGTAPAHSLYAVTALSMR